jgi:hypothetical protein
MKKSMQKFTWIGLILGILLYLSPAVLAWDYHYPSEETGVIYDRASHTYIVDNGQVTGETMDGTLIYDPTTNILTINSLSDAIDLQIKNMSEDFTINLAGDNNLSTRSSIISVNDDLTIEGDGSLIISNDSCYTYDIDSCQNSDCDYDDYEYFEDYRDYDDYDQDYGGMIDVAGNLTIKSSTIEIHALETAFLMTQLSGSTFNTDSYLASDAAKLLSETITDVIIIGEDGAVTELPEINDYTTAFYTSLTPGAKIVTVTINVTNPSDYTVTYNGIELIYNETLNLFQAEVPVTTPETLTPEIS